MMGAEINSYSIVELEQKCRKALQFDAVFKSLKVNKGAFEKICALLDFIGDSEEALSSIKTSDLRGGINRYFLAYGLLQLIYSRQVALHDVLVSLGLSSPIEGATSRLSRARHCVIGHPTSSGGASHVIVRNTLSDSGFDYWSYTENETERGNVVRYDELIEEHQRHMETGMRTLYQNISGLENLRRQEMRKTPVSPALKGADYLTQNICAALCGDKYGMMFDANSKMLLSALKELRAGLADRYGEERTSSQTDHVIEGVRMLQILFPASDDVSRNQFQIVADGVEVNIKQLIRLAADIDEEESCDLN